MPTPEEQLATLRLGATMRIPQLIREGYSANKGLAQLNREGISFRRSDFLDIWRKAVADLARAEAVASADPSMLPGAELMSQVRGYGGRGYSYRVSFLESTGEPVQRITAEGVVRAPLNIYRRTARYYYSRELISPADAIAGLQAASAAGATGTPPVETVGAFVDHLVQWTR